MTYIVATNRVRLQSYIYVGMAVINVVLAVPLTKYYGVVGLSFAIFLAYSIRTIALDIAFVRKMRLDMLRFFRCSFGRLAPSFVLTAATFLLFSYIPVGGWAGLIVKSLCATSAYVVVVMQIGANESERELFRSVVKRKSTSRKEKP